MKFSHYIVNKLH